VLPLFVHAPFVLAISCTKPAVCSSVPVCVLLRMPRMTFVISRFAALGPRRSTTQAQLLLCHLGSLCQLGSQILNKDAKEYTKPLFEVGDGFHPSFTIEKVLHI
jgi:hypothetical protein